jgi:hypothetical protein
MTTHRLPLALACACTLVFSGLSAAFAQFPPPPGQAGAPSQGNPFPPPPGQGAPQSGFGPPPGQAVQGRSGPPPAVNAFPPAGADQSICATFPALRDAAEKGALAIRAAGERKAPRDQVCNLFKSFVAQEAKMVKFLVDNQATCGIPAQAITTVKGNHAKSLEIRKNVCNPAAVVGPSLSDALGGPIIADDTSAKQPGRGTFDTLTGNALSR